MANISIRDQLSASRRQLSISLDSAKLQGMSSSERTTAVAQLASLLMEAANLAVVEGDDDQR